MDFKGTASIEVRRRWKPGRLSAGCTSTAFVMIEVKAGPHEFMSANEQLGK